MMTTVDFCEDHATRMARHRHTVLAVVAYGAIIAVAIIMAVVAFWLLYPYNPIEFTPEVHPLVGGQTAVEQGGSFAYTFAYKKHTSARPELTAAFVDGLRFQAEGMQAFLPGGEGVAIIEVEVPRTLPPGLYQLEITKVYRVNPIRTITIVNRTEQFRVIEPQ